MEKLFVIIIAFFIFLVVGCSEGGANNIPSALPCDDFNKESIKYIGYYWGASNHMGNFISEFSNYTNVVYVHCDCEECIPDAIAQGQKVIISNINDFIHGDLSAWYAYSDRLESYREHIAGFYPFDEPYHNNISIEDQEYNLKIIKERFTEIPIWVCFTPSSIRKGKSIARDYDILSITPNYGKWSAWDMKGFYDILNFIKYPHQKLFITVDGFNYDNISLTEEKNKAGQIYDYYDLAQCLDAIGMLVFIWPSFSDGIGVRDMPIVEDAIIDITETQLN